MKKGFTLMELLIVIALIGILTTIGVASYQTAQVKSRDARRKADMQVIQNAYEQYYSENSSTYPIDDSDIEGDTDFLPAGLPDDPKNTLTYVYDIDYGDGGPYWYCACAQMEGSGGNSGAACTSMGSCSGASCTHFCVRNLQ